MAGERKNRPLRLDPALDAALEKSARMNLRSMNAEITVILRRAMIEAGILKDPAHGTDED